jgi:hypothetical protein
MVKRLFIALTLTFALVGVMSLQFSQVAFGQGDHASEHRGGRSDCHGRSCDHERGGRGEGHGRPDCPGRSCDAPGRGGNHPGRGHDDNPSDEDNIPPDEITCPDDGLPYEIVDGECVVVTTDSTGVMDIGPGISSDDGLPV